MIDERRVAEIKEEILDLVGEYNRMFPGAEDWPVTGIVTIGHVLSPEGAKMIALWSDDLSTFAVLGLMQTLTEQVHAGTEGRQ